MKKLLNIRCKDIMKMCRWAFKIYDEFNFFDIFNEFLQNNQNAAILKIIKI